MKNKDFILKIVYASLALAGVISAISVIFAGSDDAIENGLSTAGLIVVTDLLIIVGLVAKDAWLRVTIWIASVIGLLLASIAVWIEIPDQWYYGPDGTYIDEGRHYGEIIGDWGGGFYAAAFVFLLAGVFAIVRNQEIEKDSLLAKVHVLSSLLAVGAGVLYAVSIGTESSGLVLRLAVATTLLSVTGGLIVIVGGTLKGYYLNTKKIEPYPHYNVYAGQKSPYVAPTVVTNTNPVQGELPLFTEDSQ